MNLQILSEKNGKWDLMKEPNMALREIMDIRPHLVLEEHICAFLCQKRFGEESERGKLGFCKKK